MRLLMPLVAAMFLSQVAAAQEGKLVLYTSQPQNDAQQLIDAFKAKHPGIDASFVRNGTPQIMARLRSEFDAGKPGADVLLIADSVTMEALKAERRLRPYDGAKTSAYPAGLNDPDKTWFATKLITTGIVYNTKAPFKPTSWADLTPTGGKEPRRSALAAEFRRGDDPYGDADIEPEGRLGLL